MNTWRWLSPLVDHFWWERADPARRDLRTLLMAHLDRIQHTPRPDGRYVRRERATRLEIAALLAEAVKLRRQLDDEILYIIGEARGRRVSWQRIAEALGCTRQSAHERYGPLVDSAELTRRFDAELAGAVREARRTLSGHRRYAHEYAFDVERAQDLLGRISPTGQLQPAEPIRVRPRRVPRKGGHMPGA